MVGRSSSRGVTWWTVGSVCGMFEGGPDSCSCSLAVAAWDISRFHWFVTLIGINWVVHKLLIILVDCESSWCLSRVSRRLFCFVSCLVSTRLLSPYKTTCEITWLNTLHVLEVWLAILVVARDGRFVCMQAVKRWIILVWNTGSYFCQHVWFCLVCFSHLMSCWYCIISINRKLMILL